VKAKFSTRRFMKYACGTVIQPTKTFSKILQDEKKLNYGFAVIITYSLLYSGLIYALFLKGIQPTLEPFLKIAAEKYYFWETFFRSSNSYYELGIIQWSYSNPCRFI